MRYIGLFIILVTSAHVFSKARENPINKNISKPNILFILIDDFGWKDVGYNGSTFYETPEIDKLAGDCMVFDNCYTPSPMCSPTRTSILTGKNPARHGITHWLPSRPNTDPKNDLKEFVREGDRFRVYCPIPVSAGIKDNEITLGEAFQNAGYETAFYGKWHMGAFKESGGPKQHGYASQKAVIQTNGCSMFFPFRNHPEYFPDAQEGDNFTDLLTDAAIDFVTAERDNPFYLHLAHFAMHHPIASKPELQKKFEEKSSSLAELEVDRVIDEQIHKPQKLRQDDPEYAGELATLDENIGRLIDALKSSGQYENTIIVLTGDNGGRSSYSRPHGTSNQPLRTGKTFLFEGGLRTPLLIHWPGHTGEGKRNSTPVSSMDFYPTLLEMAGLPLKPQQHLDGLSLVPIFNGDEVKRDAFYWHFPHYQQDGSYPCSAVRAGNYKLMFNYHFGTDLLFDVVNDPFEKNNLALKMPEKAKELHKQLMMYLSETGAYIPTPIENKSNQ